MSSLTTEKRHVARRKELADLGFRPLTAIERKKHLIRFGGTPRHIERMHRAADRLHDMNEKIRKIFWLLEKVPRSFTKREWSHVDRGLRKASDPEFRAKAIVPQSTLVGRLKAREDFDCVWVRRELLEQVVSDLSASQLQIFIGILLRVNAAPSIWCDGSTVPAGALITTAESMSRWNRGCTQRQARACLRYMVKARLALINPAGRSVERYSFMVQILDWKGYQNPAGAAV
jgi:hypothetical protein